MKRLQNTLQLLFLLLCLPFLGVLLLGFIMFEALIAVCNRMLAAMLKEDRKLEGKTE